MSTVRYILAPLKKVNTTPYTKSRYTTLQTIFTVSKFKAAVGDALVAIVASGGCEWATTAASARLSTHRSTTHMMVFD
jgi:hypothetical protein